MVQMLFPRLQRIKERKNKTGMGMSNNRPVHLTSKGEGPSDQSCRITPEGMSCDLEQPDPIVDTSNRFNALADTVTEAYADEAQGGLSVPDATGLA